MLPLASRRYRSHSQPWGNFPVPALLGQASLLLAAGVWVSHDTLLSCWWRGEEEGGREAEAGEERPLLITEVLTPPRGCVGSGMDGWWDHTSSSL